MLKRLLIILFVISFGDLGLSQIQITYIGIEQSLVKSYDVQTVVPDSISATKELKRVESQLIANGYLTANIESVTYSEASVEAIFMVGHQYRWAYILQGNADDEALIKSGYRSKILEKKTITPESLAQLHMTLVSHYENNGYPFASSRLKNIAYSDESTISAALDVTKGPLTSIDSIVIVGDSKISELYVSNYIDIKEGDVYDQSKLSAMDNRLRELPFVKVKKPAIVGFTKKFTKLYLFLDHVNCSQFNGLLGILPDKTTGKITVTGDVKIALKNAFKKGELISLNWRKLQSLTQDLEVNMNYPYLFQSQIGVNGELKVFKKDTSYLELNQRLGVQYLLSGGNYLMVYFNNYSSNLINAKKYATATVLPDFADVKFKQYGISLLQSKLDYRLNPRRGYRLKVSGAAGKKVISRNPELTETLYDNIELSSLQFKLQADVGLFVPIAKRTTIALSARSGYIINDNMFLNELFRLGGLRTLRGFDEESINASLFAVGSVEYRFLLERNSNLYVFGDYAYYERTIQNDHVSDRPFAIGAGISFQTKPGIFSINYALGSQKNNPILLRAAKIHFGFVNYF